MKTIRKFTRTLPTNVRCHAALAALATMISVPTLHAANGAWNVDAAGNWSTTTNWTPAAVPGTTAGDVVDLMFNITAARTVTIDTTSRTVGDLNIGDPTATLFGYTLASSAAGVVLNLDGVGAADATVDFRTNIANTISAPLTLVDNGFFRSNVATAQTLSGVISGTGKTVTFNNDTDGAVNAASAGNGLFLVTGNNTYTGGTTISDVRVQIQTNNTALGAAGSAVNILNGGQFYNSTGLQTMNYAFSIAGNGWAETGGPFGALRLESGAIVTGTVAMTADAAIGSNSGVGTITGVVSGGFNLSKIGSGGTIALSGVNTYAGTTTIADGTLQLRNAAAAGNATTAILLQNSGAPGAVDVNALELSGGITLARNILMDNTGTSGNARVYLRSASTVNANSNTYSGTITLKGNTGGTHQFEAVSAPMVIAGAVVLDGTTPANSLSIRGANTGTVTGTINIGASPISKTDGGTWIISSTGHTWGQTNAQDGQLQLGISNALPTTTLLEIGQGSGTNGRFELNGFNQSVAGLRTNTGSAGTAHIIRNSNLATSSTLTVTTAATETLKNVQILGTPSGLGDLTIVKQGTGRTQLDGGLHSANWNVSAGTLAFTDSTAGNVRTVLGTITGSASGTVDKSSVSVVNLAGPLNNPGTTTVTAGNLTTSTGTSNAVTVANGATLGAGWNGGVFNASSVNFGTSAGSTYAPYPGSATIAPLNVTSLTTSGTTVAVAPQGISFTPGTYAIIDYAGSIGGNGFGGFALGTGLFPHMTASLANNTTDTRVELTITAVDSLIWTGNASGVWDVNTASNFALASATSTPATFYVNDSVTFGDTSDVPGAATPVTNRTLTGGTIPIGNLTFTNTVGSDYSVASPLTGTGGITKSGNGVLTLTGASNYSGTTAINAGTFNLTGGSLTGSNITVAAGATMTATGAINNALGGPAVTITSSGTTTLAPTVASTFTGAVAVNAGTLTANYTTALPIPAANAISVASGATLRLRHDGGVFSLTNPISGAGTVIVDPSAVTAGARDIATVTWNTAGFAGTLRLAPTTGTMRIAVDNPTDLGSGTVEVANGGQIFVSAANLTFPNNITITGTGYSEAAGTLGAIRASNPSTFTGAITLSGPAKIGALGGTAVITNSISGNVLTFGGSINNAGSETLAITGNASGLTGLVINDASATSNAANITVNVGNGTASGTLGAVPVSLQADGFKSSIIRFDRTDGYTLGAGITSTSAAANHVRTFVDLDSTGTGLNDGGLTITLGSAAPNSGGTIRVGQGRANALATLTGTSTSEKIAVSAALSGATLNIGTGANISTNFFTIGETANATGGVVNQTDGVVNVVGQLRAGHFGTETATYNISGGSLTLSGASPTLTPSTAGAGGANATGDNNINGGATATIHGGGIYLGIDGVGIMNQTGGTVTTNWIVLDNRGDTAAGANMADGIDRYNLSGAGSILNLRSTYGLVARNTSTAVSFGGGTVRVDNTGTGTGTGANINIPLDATIDTVASTTTKLDTNGAGNGFTLTRDFRGTGTLNLTGGGTVNVTTTGFQNISPVLTSTGTAANLVKLGTGTTTLSGNASGYTGNISVSAGRLNLPNNLGAGAVTVADAAVLGGEPTAVTTLTLGTTTGSTLFFDPNTVGALTTGTLTVNGTNILDISALPVGAGPYTAINYTTKVGAGTFAVANPANYRVAPTVADTGSAITLDITGRKSLTWTGAASTAWNINSAVNWNDPSPAAEKFFTADTVTFPDGGLNPSIVLTGLLAPYGVTVNASTTAYTFTATAGNQIVGATGITKTNGGTLTLTGANAYTGQTSIGGGTVVINGTNSIGSGAVGNNVAISGGGRLSYNNTTALDLGVNRSIAIGAGGGSISHNNATAAAISIPGNISGSDALSFHSAGAGAGTFILSGGNSGYTGAISVDAPSTGLTALRIGASTASPGGGSITLNYPAAGASANATTLDLPGTVLGAGVTLNMTSFLNGAVSLRSQVTSSGNAFVNGPITAAGTSIVQFSPGSGTLTLNGPVTAGGGGFNGPSSVFFLRGVGNGVVNGTVTLPGAQLSKTDGGSWTINSTGNDWLSTGVLVGTLRTGAVGTLPAAANLVLGQNDTNTAVLALDGFSQTVASLASNPTTVGANTTGKSITSSTPATLTVNQSATTIYASVLTGGVSLFKDGTGSLTISGVNSQTGATIINGGVLKLGSNTAMGTNTSVTIAGGATLDVGGVANNAATRYVLNVSGTGVAGQAAIWNSGAAVVNNPVYGTINLTGDTSIGGVNRYDINGGTGGTTFNGGLNTLTKVGTNECWWSPNAGATVGNIVVDGGIFGVQIGNNLGDTASSAIIVNAAGTLYTFSNVTNSKPIVVNGGIVGANNATGTWTNTVTLNGAGTSNRFGPLAATVVALSGQVTGSGFEKIQPGTLDLQNATNNWTGDTKVSAGTVRVSGAGILSTATTLDMNGGTVDLNATAQNVSGLKGATGTILGGGSLGIAQSATTNYGGTITGTTVVTKSGVGSLTFDTASAAWTGNLNVTGGTVATGAINGGLGSFTTAGRTISASGGSTISVTTNNVFGNGVANANMPAISLDGATFSSTRYNAIGNVTLNSGAVLTQAATDGPGAYEGYQFTGTVTVGGTSASSITGTNGRANHLGANTVFTVADATGSAATDLLVSAPLKDRSADFVGTGALTKSGNGKMELTAINTYTGGTTINGGILNVNADAALGAAAGGVAISNNATLQAGGAVTTTARTVTLGAGGGTIDTNGNDVTLGAGSTLTGTTLTKVGAGKLVLSGAQTYSTLDTEAGRTDIASALGTGTSALIANAETNISVEQTLASLTIGNGAVVTLGAPLPPAPAGAGEIAGFVSDLGGGSVSVGGELAGAPIQGVPEPGSAALIFGGMLTILGLRRRR